MIDIVEHDDGSVLYFEDGVRHRDGGPAVTCPNGYKSWYRRGLSHRIDGPAIEWPSGGKEYWLDGVQYTEEEFRFRSFMVYGGTIK
jgi:hypothetical protein